MALSRSFSHSVLYAFPRLAALLSLLFVFSFPVPALASITQTIVATSCDSYGASDSGGYSRSLDPSANCPASYVKGGQVDFYENGWNYHVIWGCAPTYVFNDTTLNLSEYNLDLYTGSTCTYTDVPPPPPQCGLQAGTVKDFKFLDAFVQLPGGFCDQSCQWEIAEDSSTPYSVGGDAYASYSVVPGGPNNTGEYCNQPPPDSLDNTYSNGCPADLVNIGGFCQPKAAKNCPDGTSYGQFNDIFFCADVNPTNCGFVGDVYKCVEPGVDCATQATNAGLDPVKYCGSSPLPDDSGDSSGGKTPGHDTGSCPTGVPDCGALSGSASGYCDPAVDVDVGCVADGGIKNGGKDSGVCPASNPDCGSGSGSSKGKCDVKVDTECSPSSVGEGVCDAGARLAPTCKGDAISCAIALNTWNQRCDAQLNRKEDKGTDDWLKGDSLLDADNPANKIKTDEKDFSTVVSGLDVSGSGYGAGGECPPDPSFSVFGSSVYLPLHYLCDMASTIRPVVIALGWFSAAMIIFGFLREK